MLYDTYVHTVLCLLLLFGRLLVWLNVIPSVAFPFIAFSEFLYGTLQVSNV